MTSPEHFRIATLPDGHALSGSIHGTYRLIALVLSFYCRPRLMTAQWPSMIAVLILVIALAALAHFVMIYWRAVLASVATEELSESVRLAAQIQGAEPTRDDFLRVAALHDACPDLAADGPGIGRVRTYFHIVSVLGKLLPILSEWSACETALCTRYVAVLVDQRLQQNFAQAQQFRA